MLRPVIKQSKEDSVFYDDLFKKWHPKATSEVRSAVTRAFALGHGHAMAMAQMIKKVQRSATSTLVVAACIGMTQTLYVLTARGIVKRLFQPLGGYLATMYVWRLLISASFVVLVNFAT